MTAKSNDFFQVACPASEQVAMEEEGFGDEDELIMRYRECFGKFWEPFTVFFILGIVWGSFLVFLYFLMSKNLTKGRAMRKVRVKVNNKKEDRKRRKWEARQREHMSRETGGGTMEESEEEEEETDIDC